MANENGQNQIMWRVSDKVIGVVDAAQRQLETRDRVTWSRTKVIEYMLQLAADQMGIAVQAGE